MFVFGFDGDGDVLLFEFEFVDCFVVIVVGLEGKGFLCLVIEICD